jgi:MarR family transcriptional regulator, transcriptional regulator for hemolysin
MHLSRRGDAATFNPGSDASADAHRLRALLNALLGSTVDQFLWRQAAEPELTSSQAQVLLSIEQHAGCDMGEVAKAFDVTLPAITQIVDCLAQKSFVTRGDDPADRRVYMLELTTAGKALVYKLQRLQIEGLEPVVAGMSALDRRHVLRGVTALVTAAGEGRHDVKGQGRGSRQKPHCPALPGVQHGCRDHLRLARVQQRMFTCKCR